MVNKYIRNENDTRTRVHVLYTYVDKTHTKFAAFGFSDSGTYFDQYFGTYLGHGGGFANTAALSALAQL